MTVEGLVRRVVIVGGGSAGWMTAAAMARLLMPSGVEVTLVESDAIGTVGVGEATIPTIRDFNALLGIDEHQFIRETGGSFKLGIEFVDWGRLGNRYFHPFGTFGRDTRTLRFHQLWLRRRHDDGRSEQERLEHYSMAALAASRGRFGTPSSDPNHPLSTISYAYHFDAGRYAMLLRRWSEAKGVRRIEGRITDVRRSDRDGAVASIALENGTEIVGDLFIDCSGFASLLLGRAMAEPIEDWSHWLPCDRAIALPSARSGPVLPYTRSTAVRGGWRWRIPLQHRTGSGIVYSSAHLSDEAALKELRAGLDGEAVGEPRRLRFIAGHRRRLWSRNVVAIGLSGGFLEPLESTSIHLIQTAITRLLTLFPTAAGWQAERAEFNRQSVSEYERIRDFLILHYKASARDDDAFWRYCGDMRVPDSLARRLDLFRAAGRIFREGDELFSESSWLAVMVGQGIMPHAHDPAADAIPPLSLATQMAAMRSALARAADQLALHEDYISSCCAAASAVDASSPDVRWPAIDPSRMAAEP